MFQNETNAPTYDKMYHMNTNGRSTHFITTTDADRRALWLRLFGSEWLPVKSARPRWQVDRVGVEVLAFDLDASRLHIMAQARFAGYVARRDGIAYDTALSLVNGWPVKAVGCIVETAVSETWEKRPFRFARGIYAN